MVFGWEILLLTFGVVKADVFEFVPVVGYSTGDSISLLRGEFSACQGTVFTHKLPTDPLSSKAFPLVFGNNHGFNLWQTGLTFLGLFLGNVIGVSCDPFWRRNCEFPVGRSSLSIACY